MDLKATHKLAKLLEPIHSQIYFAPEAEENFVAAGLRPGRMCYFAGRAAPMGEVGPGAVAATFYNFNPETVAKYIPRAWTLTTPKAVVEARWKAADASLRRLLGDELVASAEMAEAAQLARVASEACTPDGRALYAGHADLEWPEEPHLVYWHAITLLREFRGDGHIAALVQAGLSGIEALIAHTAAGTGFLPEAAKSTRGWSDEQWAAGEESLRAKGLLDADGAPTERGTALRAEVEDHTDRLDLAPWAHLGAERCARLGELAHPITVTALKAGAFPAGVFAKK
ncbi:hypothetical protein GCM10010174_75180 [Kutzneria viridogrisea]|uniref:SalK n=2 Tax=Kutzneria TaxID=43356 RepID=W5W5G3_9PSEU|nr:hypothetical protein [Kutzneria albida]AHH96478.1 hypothetical protein KALB_3111 [Kutzneria albida DSM 43870]MBA8928304.1 hypothetical protein [Kutzneria viridogrisea]